MMVGSNVFCWIFLNWLWTAVTIHAEISYDLYIGGIFLEKAMDKQIAFRSAISASNRILQQSSSLFSYRLVPKIKTVKVLNSFEVAKRACDLFHEGVIALHGPSEPLIAHQLIALSQQVNVPYLHSDWNYWDSGSTFSINIQPHYRRFGEAVGNYIKKQKWNSLAFVYSSDESLLKFEPIINHFNSRLLLRRWQAPEEKHQYAMKYLMNSGHKLFVVDIPYWQMKDFLVMASIYNMTSAYYSFIFPDWDTQLLDLKAFKIKNDANISTFSILNESHYLQQHSDYSLMVEKVFQVVQQNYPLGDLRKVMPTPAALVYDAVLLLTHGLLSLAKIQPIYSPHGLSCEGNEYWPLGASLVNAINTIPWNSWQGLTGNVQLSSGIRDDFHMVILEFHKNGIEQFGLWNKERGIAVTKPYSQTKKEVLKRLNNMTLRVTTVVTDPFVMALKYDENGVAYSHPDNWDGFCMELLKEIARDIKFNFTVYEVSDKSYGTMSKKIDKNTDTETEEWDGLVDELISGRADLAVASLTITYERERVIDFTTPFMSLGLSILYKRPEGKKPTLFSFLQPLSPPVWGYVLAAYIMVSFVLFVVARFSPYEWFNPQSCHVNSNIAESQFTMLNSLWFTIGSLMQQGSELAPKATSTRIVAGTWWFFTLIIISSYTANLAAFLTVERMQSPIDNAEDLSKQTRIKYGTLLGGASYSFFEKSNIETYKRMWQYMNSNRDKAFVNSIDEGIERVKKEDYAFILESTMNEFYTQRNCSLMTVGGLLDSKGYGIGLPRGSPYTDIFSEKILELQDRQIIQFMKEKYWSVGLNCSHSNKERLERNELRMEHVGGVFLFLGSGLFASIIVAMSELLWKVKTFHPTIRQNDQTGNACFRRRSLGEIICAQMHFSMRCLASSSYEAHKLPPYCHLFSPDRDNDEVFRRLVQDQAAVSSSEFQEAKTTLHEL